MKIPCILLFFLVSVTTFGQIKSIHIEDSYAVYKTSKNIDVEPSLVYETKVKGSNIDNETIIKLLRLTNAAIKTTLKSSRSFVPINYHVIFKPKKNKKHKYSVRINYAATNSYGGEVDGFETLEFNHKFRETVGSAMLRMN